MALSFHAWAYSISQALAARYGREIETDTPEFRELHAEGATVKEFLSAVESHVRQRLGEIDGRPDPLDEAAP